MKWHVMTSAAKMPQSCSGRYHNVALVLIADGCEPPKIITDNAKQVLKLRHLGHHHEGKTARCAYGKMLAWATAEAERLNLKLDREDAV